MLNLYRRTVLGVANLPPVSAFVRRYGERLGARRFIAGPDVRTAADALHALESSGRTVLLDVLGEYVRDEARARAMEDDLHAAIDALVAEGIAPVVSVKPTQLGLALDADLAFEAADRVAEHAERLGGRMALDMEDIRYTDGTLALVRRLWAAGRLGAGAVLQAYLHRTPDDLEALLAAAPDVHKVEVRIVKGAYAEPREHVLGDLPSIRRAFTRACVRAWEAGARVDVATHDERLLREAIRHVRSSGIEPTRFEIQMIYGVKPNLQARLVAEGHPLRVYVPVGSDWYGYYSRRLAERPANLGLVLRGLFG